MPKTQFQSVNGQKNIDSELKKAFLAQKSGQIDTARQFCRRVLKRKPNDPDALHLMGIVLHQLGMPDEAVGFLLKAVGVNAANAMYYNSLGGVFRGTIIQISVQMYIGEIPHFI